MPILNNMGNIMYVVVAVVFGVFIALNIQNIFISGLPFTIAVAVPFLNMTRFLPRLTRFLARHLLLWVLLVLIEFLNYLDEPAETDEGCGYFSQRRNH